MTDQLEATAHLTDSQRRHILEAACRAACHGKPAPSFNGADLAEVLRSFRGDRTRDDHLAGLIQGLASYATRGEIAVTIAGRLNVTIDDPPREVPPTFLFLGTASANAAS